MLKGMEYGRIKELANSLKVHTEVLENDNIFIESIRRKILLWTHDWKSEIDKASMENSNIPQTQQQDKQAKHRDFNDELVDNGFFDFAYSVMVLELHAVNLESTAHEIPSAAHGAAEPGSSH